MTVSLRSSLVAVMAAGTACANELIHCWQAVLARGGEPVFVAPARSLLEPPPERWHADFGLAEVQLRGARPSDYAGLVLLRGGDADEMPSSAAALDFITGFFELGLPVAAGCYGVLDLARASLLGGRTVTSARRLRTRLAAAGATWVARPVARCADGPNVLLTACTTASMPAFCDEFTRAFADPGLTFRPEGSPATEPTR